MKEIGKKIIILCYVCCIIAIGVFINFINDDFSIKEEHITGEITALFNTGWEILEGNKPKNISIDTRRQMLPTNANGTIVLTNTLPAVLREGDTLSFYSYHQNVEVIVDGKIIYKYGSRENTRFGKLSGCAINIFVIPKQYSGKTMKVILTNTHNDTEGYVPMFYIGTETAQIKHIMSEWWLGILITIAIAVLGIIQIIQWLLLTNRKVEKSTLYLGVCAINLAVWFACDMPVSGFLFGNSIAFMYICYLALTVLPVPISLFLENILNKKYKWIFRIIQIVAVINFFTCIFLQVKGIFDLRELLITTHILIIILIVVVLSIYIYEDKVLHSRFALLKNRFLKMSSTFLIVAAIVDIIRYYISASSDSTMFIRMGLFIFLLAINGTINSANMELEAITKEVEKYEKLAYTDLMTGLYNRAAYEEALIRIKEKIEENRNIAVAVVLYDLNDLKIVNDTKGHKAGDFYLNSFATILKGIYGNDGKCYRIGGDEFVVLSEGIAVRKYESLRKLLLEKIERYNAKSELKMSVAQGFARYDCAIDANFEDTVKRADKAMYINKKEMKLGREIR